MPIGFTLTELSLNFENLPLSFIIIYDDSNESRLFIESLGDKISDIDLIKLKHRKYFDNKINFQCPLVLKYEYGRRKIISSDQIFDCL